MARVCKKCGASMEDSDRFCTVCGAAVDMDFQAEAVNSASENTQSATKEESVKECTAKQNTADMDALEKEPLTLGNYLILFLIFAIPIVNIVFFLLWAFGKGGNVNRKNFSGAALIYIAVASVLTIVIAMGVFGKVAYEMIRYGNGIYHHGNGIHHYVYEWDDDDWDVWTEATPLSS